MNLQYLPTLQSGFVSDNSNAQLLLQIGTLRIEMYVIHPWHLTTSALTETAESINCTESNETENIRKAYRTYTPISFIPHRVAFCPALSFIRTYSKSKKNDWYKRKKRVRNTDWTENATCSDQGSMIAIKIDPIAYGALYNYVSLILERATICPQSDGVFHMYNVYIITNTLSSLRHWSTRVNKLVSFTNPYVFPTGNKENYKHCSHYYHCYYWRPIVCCLNIAAGYI